jgi:hypothetical protein
MSDFIATIAVFGGVYVAYKVYEKASYEYEFNQARKKFKPFSCSGLGRTEVDADTGEKIRLYSKPECDAMNADSFFPWYGHFLGGECVKSPSVIYPQYRGGSFSYDCKDAE